MTIAVCLNCGAEKIGAFVACSCGFKPVTTVEYCLNATFSDHWKGISLPALQELVRLINQGGDWVPSYELVITHGILIQYIQDWKWRKMFGLKTAAKKGWLRDKIDMHSVGPKGYEHSALVCGRDIDKAVCKAARKIGDDALFCVWTYEHGKRDSSFVTPELWLSHVRQERDH